MKYRSNNPKRRIAQPNHFRQADLVHFAENAVYEGKGHHKLHPADYGFDPPVSPRPWKSVCDDLRVIKRLEAGRLFKDGLRRRMVSTYLIDGLPKYVWAVDAERQVYEAKRGTDGTRSTYHGYRLRDDEEDMHKWVVDEWRRRRRLDVLA